MFMFICLILVVFLMFLRTPRSTLFPYTTLFRSRRGLAIDSTVDIFTFYVPHRHVYGEQWIKFMKDGVNATVHHKRDDRSEERFSRNAETDLVCRLLLEKKKKYVFNAKNDKQNHQ